MDSDVNVLVAFSVAPGSADPDGSVSAAVAEAIRIVRDSGLPNETNAMFTNLEGSWDQVMDMVGRATEAVVAHADRVSLVLKADIRRGRHDQLAAKVQRVDDRLAGTDPTS